jgi:O6-methylguanine-DNA--protein-cysteine methyltransferase
MKSDGSLGGFSGKEGVVLKKKMIDLESEGK